MDRNIVVHNFPRSGVEARDGASSVVILINGAGAAPAHDQNRGRSGELPAIPAYRRLWVEADIRFLRSSRAAIGILATFRGRRANVSLKSKSGDAIEHARALTRCIVPRS